MKRTPIKRAQASPPVADIATEARFNQCLKLALDDPASGIADANEWRMDGGGFLARHCLGFAYAEQYSWQPAMNAFAEAARQAGIEKYPRTADFWAQAGNAALANGAAEKALEYLNTALVQGTLTGLEKGEVHLDLARAYVAAGQYGKAKEEFAVVHKLAPQDPLGWLLSATLARRMEELALAKADIAAAAKLAGGDPEVALEAGNIAYAARDITAAVTFWKQAVEFDSGSAPADVAAKYLAQLKQGPPLPETP